MAGGTAAWNTARAVDGPWSAIDVELRRARRRLARAVPAVHPGAAVRHARRHPATGARWLDRVCRGAGLQRAGDDGPAVRSDRTLPLRHQALGRRRDLPLPPADLADRGGPGVRPPADHLCRAARAAGAARRWPRTAWRGGRGGVDRRAGPAGGDRAVARPLQDWLRALACQPHRAGAGGGGRRAGAHDRLEFLSGRPAQACAVDRPGAVLDRAAAVRACVQAAVHAAPALPYRRGAGRAR